MSTISLLLQESDAKLRTSVDNKNIAQMSLGYNLLLSQCMGRSKMNDSDVND